LGLSVGFGYPTQIQTQILRHLKAPTQNPYPNTQKNPYPYPYPYRNTQKKTIPIPKTHTQILKKIKSL